MSYHDRPELSSSQVASFLSDPIEWYHVHIAKDWPRPAPTKEMQFGTDVHAMIEHGGSDAIVKEIPANVLNADGHCKGKAWLDWKAANPANVYLKPGEPNPLATIWDHLNANQWCKRFIASSTKELEHVWDDPDLGPCRVKFDALLGGTVVDWKTTAKRCARTFAADAYARFYDVRLALYRRGHYSLYGTYPEVVIVAIETSGGMKVTPYRMPEDWLEEAEARLIFAVDDMKRFNLDEYLNQSVVQLEKPRYATFNLEAVE